MTWTMDGRKIVDPRFVPDLRLDRKWPMWIEDGPLVLPAPEGSVMTQAPVEESSTIGNAVDVERMKAIYMMIEDEMRVVRERQAKDMVAMSLAGLSKMAPGNYGGSIEITREEIVREARPTVSLMPKPPEKQRVAPVDLPRRTFDFGESDAKG